MDHRFIIAIDQGTSGTKSVVVDAMGRIRAKGFQALTTQYSPDGFVEQDPNEIWESVLTAVRKCIADFEKKGGARDQLACCGISNQRETFVIWNKEGIPLHKAVVWQCKRSTEICSRWKKEGFEHMIKSKSGLIIDPYFSGSKVRWLYENISRVREAVDASEAYFGTVDTWLLYKLTGGVCYFTDYTNASRTLFFNLKELAWDPELLKIFGLEHLRLPELKSSSALFGNTDFNGILPSPIPVTGLIGDSHAAAFGEGCFSPGQAKATLGTGCSILMNTGKLPVDSTHGMVTTICWSTENLVHFALEGVIVSCGSTIEWLKNALGLFANSQQTASMAMEIQDNGGVYLVPAFSGLGAPHWDMNRKASISGLTLGSTKNHLVRAALESIPFQIKDVLNAMESDTGRQLQQLMVDGGISSNPFVMQSLADLLDKKVVSIGQPDVSAIGAAYLSGLKTGIFESLDQLARLIEHKAVYLPRENNKAEQYYQGWKTALLKN